MTKKKITSTRTTRTEAAATPASAALRESIDALREWLARGQAVRAAAWAAPGARGSLPEAAAIQMTDDSAQLGLLVSVVEAALAAVDMGRTEDDQPVTTTIRPARRNGLLVEPASVTVTFGALYQAAVNLEPLGDEPGRWRKLARLSADFGGFASTWQRVGHPRITDDELDALADRVVARATWPRLDELREMFRDVDRARAAARVEVVS